MTLPYVRMTVDVEELFTIILRDALGDIAEAYGTAEMSVMSQQDVDAIDHMPLIVVQAANGHMLNGPNAWEWDLFVNIAALTRDSAADIADMVYVALHTSHDKNTRVPGVGAVTSVDDVSMPSRTSTSLMPAGDLTQYDGQFRVVVRKI